jgi:hypothetical protein
MDRLDLPVSNRRYAAIGVRVGVPAGSALLVHLALVPGVTTAGPACQHHP